MVMFLSSGISAWLLWFILTLVLLVFEISTVNLVSIWFALGTLAATIVALFKGSVFLQVTVFVLVSAFALAAFWFFRSKLKLSSKGIERTNADMNIGKTGLVLEEINDLHAKGQVKVEGQVWSASSHDGSIIAPTSLVKVLKIKGVKLIVKEVDREDE